MRLDVHQPCHGHLYRGLISQHRRLSGGGGHHRPHGVPPGGPHGGAPGHGRGGAPCGGSSRPFVGHIFLFALCLRFFLVYFGFDACLIPEASIGQGGQGEVRGLGGGR